MVCYTMNMDSQQQAELIYKLVFVARKEFLKEAVQHLNYNSSYITDLAYIKKFEKDLQGYGK